MIDIFRVLKNLRKAYHHGSYREMITLRFTKEILPFQSYLKEIILDNPGVKDNNSGINFGTESRSILKETIQKSRFLNYDNVTKVIRNCSNCYCQRKLFKASGNFEIKRSISCYITILKTLLLEFLISNVFFLLIIMI